MEDHDLAIGGRAKVDLDDVGAVPEGRLHRAHRVLEIVMRWRMDAGCGAAGPHVEAGRIEGLADPTVRHDERALCRSLAKGNPEAIHRDSVHDDRQREGPRQTRGACQAATEAGLQRGRTGL
ncbi:MAG: hypothetical protein AAGE01_02845 [Pseudomonadota bacterium]